MKKATLLLLSITVVSFTGCAKLGLTDKDQRTTIRQSVDPITQMPITTSVVEDVKEEDTDFWTSGNLRMYYESDGKRVDAHQTLATEKIIFIREQGAKRQMDLQTPTERVLSNVVDTLLVAAIPTSAPAPSSPPPKIMADIAGGSLIPLLDRGLMLASWAFDIDSPWNMSNRDNDNDNGGGADLEQVYAGRDIFIGSERNDAYSLSDQGVLSFSDSPTYEFKKESENSSAGPQDLSNEDINQLF